MAPDRSDTSSAAAIGDRGEPLGPAPMAHSSDALEAIRNAFKLGGSLLCTWGIAFAIRFLLPRYLGPEANGRLTFADNFTAGVFIVLSLGLDTYIRKEIPVRPRHANDFFASTLAMRAAGSALVFLGMALFLELTGEPQAVREVVYLFGLAQFFATNNLSLAALLHANATVDGLSITNVVSKLLWGAGTLLSIFLLGGSLAWIAAAFLMSEAVKFGLSYYLVRKHLGVQLTHFELSAVKVVFVSSLPFYLNNVAHVLYNKTFDVSILKQYAPEAEVGWYGAASNFGGLAMMIAPVIGWVVMPLFSRALARSEAEYTQVLRRSLEMILIIALPTSLAIGVGADVWIALLFGEAFTPATLALRILAPIYTWIYVSMISNISLNLNDKAWTATAVSLGGMVVNPVLNFLLIPPILRAFPVAGAGGAACAIAQFITEALVAVVMMVIVGRRAFDRRTVVMLGKTLVVCGLVLCIDRLVAWVGPARLLIDAVAYCVLIVLFRAIHLQETFDFALAAFRRRRDPAVA